MSHYYADIRILIACAVTDNSNVLHVCCCCCVWQQDCLKYVVLANMLALSDINPFAAREAKVLNSYTKTSVTFISVTETNITLVNVYS
jgi:hypothetical protein